MDNKNCLVCQKRYEAKRPSSKFCSVKCRVEWHRKNGKKNAIKPLDVTFLLNDFKATMADFKEMVNGGRLGVQDLTQPTHQIKPVTDPKPQSNVVHTVLPPKPNMSEYGVFEARLKEATMISEIEEIMKGVKSALMMPREKLALENLAKELSKEMYSD